MPVAGAGPGGSRQPSRPPWVKDIPPPMPMPSQPWVKSARAPATADTKEAAGVVSKVLRKVSDAGKPVEPANTSSTPERKKSSITIIPMQVNENGSPSKSPEPVKKDPPRKISEPAQPPPVKAISRKVSEPVKAQKPPIEPSRKVAEKPPEKTIPVERTSSRPKVLERTLTSDKYEGVAPKPPAAPPMPPPPPPLPSTKEMLPEKSAITDVQKEKLESLRSRPKRRPDWGNMMKEIETGAKLKHIQCNDRSAPMLSACKAKGQFVYESERPNLHNQLLKQISSGIRLKPTKTNDRSKPFLDGLRKFRRQMTIEEQIQKSTSIASMGIAEVEPDPLDEVDDIDKVRDDLQSTKQMLAMELKNKEAMERENKKLLTRILNLEVELEKERNRTNKESSGTGDDTKKEMAELRISSEQAKKLAEEMESQYHETSAKLDLTKLELDEAVQKAQRLEKQLRVAQAANLANSAGPIRKQPSAKKIASQHKMGEMAPPVGNEDSEESETESESESESESDTAEDTEENAAAAAERREARELKLLASKLKSFKDKREQARKERKSLKEQTKKHQKSLREEKKKYKVLQKEVDKMSKLVNEGDEDEEEDEEEEEQEEEETESEPSESESESETESEESEDDLPESAPADKRKANLQTRVKRYENLVSSLKKGNYLLKANVERHRDELNKQKEMAITLQEDLNSVLEELG